MKNTTDSHRALSASDLFAVGDRVIAAQRLGPPDGGKGLGPPDGGKGLMQPGDVLTIVATRPNGWYEVLPLNGNSFLVRHRELHSGERLGFKALAEGSDQTTISW